LFSPQSPSPVLLNPDPTSDDYNLAASKMATALECQKQEMMADAIFSIFIILLVFLIIYLVFHRPIGSSIISRVESRMQYAPI